MLGETDKSFPCCCNSATFNLLERHLIAVFRPVLRVTKRTVNVAILNHNCSKIDTICKSLTCKYFENAYRGMFLLLMLQVNDVQLYQRVVHSELFFMPFANENLQHSV